MDGGAALQEDLERGIAVVPQRITVGGREFVDDGNTDAYAAFYAAAPRRGGERDVDAVAGGVPGRVPAE